MPKMMPEISPGPSEPSRSEKSALRHQPTNNSTGSAPIERSIACIIAGMSGSASFTATWLNPQDRQSISISATAPGLSGRPAVDFTSIDDISSFVTGLTAVLLVLGGLLAVRAGAGDLNDGELRCK